MAAAITIQNLYKTYRSGQQALKGIDLEIRRGEIFALLGPNGAGKTTLINAICGLVSPSGGTILVDGDDHIRHYRAVRARIGLVPQELTMGAFESVWASVTFSRGLFGKPADPAYLEGLLRELSLWERRGDRIMTLSGGMKRRVLIAKALAHEPRILFLDEPTAGVDVALRQEMWEMVRRLRHSGVTIILTTHYIQEAEAMADRIGVINRGEIVVVEEKSTLMSRLGKRQLIVRLQAAIDRLPAGLEGYRLELAEGGTEIIYTFDSNTDHTGISALLRALDRQGIEFTDLHTRQSSLEEIFVSLLKETA